MTIRATLTTFGAGAILAAAVLAAPVAAATEPAGDVAAIVNGQKIYKKDVMSAIKELGQKLGNADVKQVYPMVVEQIINEKLLDDAAAAAKVEQTKEYKAREAAMKAQLVKQLYFEKLLKNKVSEDSVKAAYNQFKNENKDKMEVRARHILVPSEVEAKKVIADLEKGAKFEELAQQRSSGPTAKNGGDLGYFLKEEMIPAFSDVAFNLKPGTYSKEPVKTEFGWHVIRVEDKRERTVPEYAAVAPAIRNKLSQVALAKVLQELRGKAELKVFDFEGKPVGAAGAAPAAAPAGDKTGNAAQAQEAAEAAAKKDDKKEEKKD